MFKLLLTLAIVHVHGVRANVLWESMEGAEGEEDTTELFIRVVRSNFKKIRSLVFLYESSHDDHLISDLVGNQPFYSIEVAPDSSGAKRFNGKYDLGRPYNDFITFEESKLYIYKANEDDTFSSALRTMQRLYFYRERDKLIIVMKHELDHERMIQALLKRSMNNVIFIYTNGSVFTFDQLENNTWFEINDRNYFYNKLTDFKRNVIRISMFSHVRDAIPIEWNEEDVDLYKGHDGLLAEAFMNFINATGKYIPPTDGITYGENRGKGNITGVFGDVARNISDVALNSRLMKPEFENVVEYSYPHGRDDLIILVPCGNADNIIEYYKSFEGVVWLSIVFFNIFCMVVFIKTKTFDRASTAALYAFGIFFGQSHSTSRTVIGRVLVLMYTFYSFLILVHYSSLLMSIITVPNKPKEIDTFEELAESHLKMYTVERYKRYLVTYGEQSVRDLENRIFILSEKQVNDMIDAHGDYAVICKRSVADWAILNRRNYRNGRQVHRIMTKSPFPTIICYIVKYGSAFKWTLNSYVRRIMESGIQDYLLSTTLNEIFWEENRHYHEVFDPEKQIALDELIPIFLIYCIGNVGAMLLFAGEVYCKK